jgi:hypothetical protein
VFNSWYFALTEDKSSLLLLTDVIRFVGENMLKEEHSSESITAFREVGERALTAGGLHLSEGVHLWNVFRSAGSFKSYGAVEKM